MKWRKLGSGWSCVVLKKGSLEMRLEVRKVEGTTIEDKKIGMA